MSIDFRAQRPEGMSDNVDFDCSHSLEREASITPFDIHLRANFLTPRLTDSSPTRWLLARSLPLSPPVTLSSYVQSPHFF